MTVRLELKDAERYFRGELSQRMTRAVKDGLYSAALATVQDIQVNIIPSVVPPPVNKGTYRAGWRAEQTDGGADVYNTVPHAAFIENGVFGPRVRIGRQMIEAIAEWARLKGIGGNRPTAVAFAIAKRMQTTGIFAAGQGLKVMERARLYYIADNIREGVTRAIEEMKGAL